MNQILQLWNIFRRQKKMDIKDVKLIINQDDNSKDALQSLIAKTEKVFVFPELNEGNLRLDLWNSLYIMASTTQDVEIRTNCFSALRILSRDKVMLDKLVMASDWLNLIKKIIGLDDIEMEFSEETKMVAIEAEKCLCNLVFNSNTAARECTENKILYNINERIKYYNKPSFPEEIKFFDMKLLFIITALRPEVREPLGDEKNAISNLIKLLDDILMEEGEIKDKSVDLACEILKAMFNLTVYKYVQIREEQKEEYIKLVKMLRKYLLIPVESEEKRLNLHNNVVNLLTNIPNPFYADLVPPVSSEFEADLEKLEYCGQDISAIKKILELLEAKLEINNPINKQLELISPIVTVLYKGACTDRIIRKYLRSEILPPLKDIYSRPEEGTALRNHLCRQLTSPITQLRDVVSEFLFVLCKKNVRRMIKYTGYGNSAGLFAQRGLLDGKQDEEAAEFSSDSENSDTEEYVENKHKINPVLGCFEPPRPDPMAGMSEEQKEYEALRIVELMDALTRSGPLKPCKIDENGKPVPIEHVLELQETIKNNELCKKTKKID